MLSLSLSPTASPVAPLLPLLAVPGASWLASRLATHGVSHATGKQTAMAAGCC
jgi:hypothetical protein